MPTAQPFTNTPSTGFVGTATLGGAGELRLPGARGLWTWCVSADVMHCKRGHIVPMLAKAWHQSGMSTNPPVNSQGEGFLTELGRLGYSAIPHDPARLEFQVEAFGEVRTQPPSCYLDRYTGLYQGRPAVYWSPAWERYRLDRRRTVREFDEEAELAFLLNVRKQFIGELDDAMIAAATGPLYSEIRQQVGRDGARAALALRDRLAQVPVEHAPPDILALIEQHQVKPPTPKKRGRTAKQ